VHTTLLDNDLYRIIYGNISYCVFMLVVPLATLTVLNLRLMAALKDVNQKRREMQSARQRQDNNVTLVLIVVVIVFSVCQFPALVTQLSWNFLPDSARQCGGFQFYFSRISNALVIANSAVNFLIYFRFNNRFRTILGQIIPGRSSSAGYGVSVSRRQHLISMTTVAAKDSTTEHLVAAATRVGVGRSGNTSASAGLLPIATAEHQLTTAGDGSAPTPTTMEPISPQGGGTNVDDIGANGSASFCETATSM